MAASEFETTSPELSPAQLCIAIDAARHAATRLRTRSVDTVLAAIDRVIVNWLRPDSTWRQRAERLLPASTGFSPQMIHHGLPQLLEPMRADAVRTLLETELGGLPDDAHAISPSLITHVLSGNIPGLAAAPIVLSLAIKSAVLVKAATGDLVFPALFAASIREVDDELAQCLVVARWHGGEQLIERVAFTADLVVASGSDTAVAAIAARVAGRFIAHGHKISFAAIGRERLENARIAGDLARRLAYDVSLWDQQGCLSPQLCYIESGAAVRPEQFAGMLADALARFASELPPRRLSLDERAAVLHFRQATEWRVGHTLLASQESTDWTISIEPNAEFLPSCLNRCIRLKVVDSLAELAPALASHRRHLEAAGIAVAPEREPGVSTLLSASGLHHICPLGTMQTPTLSWRQGGRPRVAEWVGVVDDPSVREWQRGARTR